jgi:hypothetical protein
MSQFIKKKIWVSLFGVAVSAISMSAYANPNEKPQVPVAPEQKLIPKSPYVIKNKDLEGTLPKQAAEWLETIKRNNPQLNCPQSSGSASCLFLGSVNIDEADGEYQITLKGSSFIDGYIALPSIAKISSQEANSKVWFKKVLVNNKDAEVVERNGQLMAGVDKGDFDLKIVISKSNSKELASIAFENTPLILINNVKNKNFIKDGNIVRIAELTITNDKNQQSSLEKNTNQEELQINVFRKISTEIPNILNTKIKITYSGKPKDFFLGKVLPEGFEFNSASSNLKIEKKEDGFWVKLVSGENYLNIESFLLKNVSNIKVAGLIKSADNEIWSLQQNTNIRQVEISSNKQLDPKQAMVPTEWNSLPAYLVKDDFNMKDNHRGIEENRNIDIKINRTSFFGFNKNEMFHLDNMEVKNYGVQFLNKNGLSNPESFRINEQDQVLLNNNKDLGVIIPKGDFNATSQIITKDDTVPVQFWDGKTNIASWTINLAPRMKMFAATGESIKSYGTWLDHWNLYIIFSVFLTVLAFYKLFGRITAIMALIGLLIFQNQVFSWSLWLTMLFILGLQKILPEPSESKLSRITNKTGLVALGLFCLYAISFIKQEIQLMINPSLEIVSNHLTLVNSDNYIMHLIVLSVLGVFLFKEKTEQANVKRSVSIVPAITFLICAAFFLSLPTLLSSGRNSVMGTGASTASIDSSQLRTLGEVAPAPAAAPMPMAPEALSDKPVGISSLGLSSNVVAKKFQKEEMVDNIVLKKAQVGSGIPNWNGFAPNTYTIQSSGVISNDSKVHFWIAPIWLVNIFSFIQIAFLLGSIFVFGVGLLHLSNKEDWFNKIPYSIRRNKLVQILLINDLKKGFAK